jgi:hypothetical protein
MTRSKGERREKNKRPQEHALRGHQLRAAASPAIPLRKLAQEEQPVEAAGNFSDLESLLDQLGEPPLFELGKPLPRERYLPQRGLSTCPAAHNRALLDKDSN